MTTAITSRPRWLALTVVAGVVAVCTVAGFWQLGRADDKRALYSAYARGEDSPASDGLVADTESDGQRYQRLRITGRYDSPHQVLLDNMVQDGRPGYHVLTPFRTASGNVLVNRGWVPADGDRTNLPAVAVGGEVRTLTGRIDRLPRPGIRMAPAAVTTLSPWPRRLLFPDSAEIGAQLGYPVRDYQLLLDPSVPDGYRRAWRPDLLAPEQHVAYAVQWFGLAAALIVLCVIALRHPRGRPNT